MSQNYLPFFRKYRPQSFKDLVGQDNLVKTLSAAIETGKISHAYLFSGPRGTGKTSSARIFAKSLNCKNAPTLTPCQTCQSCIDITNSVGVDVIELDAATNRGIDDAKKIIEQTQYAPMNGKYKIFIIDEAHMLTKEAFNALLKTLEEPPQNVIFILATTEPNKIIETIVSRCQRFDFRRITTDDIVKKLSDVSKLENIKITREALYTIANNVSGGMRDSLALLDQVSILGQKEEITKETIESLIGKIRFDVLYDISDKILSGNIEASIKALNEIYKRGNEPKNFTENLIEFLRNAIIVKSTNEKEFDFAKINSSEVQKLSDSSWDKISLVKLLDKTIELYKDIKNAANPYLWSEVLVVELCSINELKSEVHYVEKKAIHNQPIKMPKPQVEEIREEKPQVDEIKKPQIEEAKEESPQIKETENKEEENEPFIEEKEPEIKAQAPQKEEESASSMPQNAQVWVNILNSIESIPAKFFFSGISKLISIDDKKITLGFLNQNFIKQAQSPSKANALKAAIKNVFENELDVEYIMISKDMPTIEIKSQIKQAPKKVYREEYTTKPQELKEEEEKDRTNVEGEEKKSETVEIYSNKTKEMIDNFSGKVID